MKRFRKVYTESQYEECRRLWFEGKHTSIEIAELTGVQVGAVYMWTSRYWRKEKYPEKSSGEAIDVFLRRPAA